jgi:hypothetical protein
MSHLGFLNLRDWSILFHLFVHSVFFNETEMMEKQKRGG